jgi:hypothetical protein
VNPRTATHVCFLLIAAVGLPAAGPRGARPSLPELPPLNRKVVDFVKRQVGAKVANGQCTALATEALRAAGARRFPFHGTGGDYVWGHPVASFREAIPGDIVQFRDAVFRGTSWVTSRRWVAWHQDYPHHTAVVSEVREKGKVVVLLHQNVGPDGTSVERKQVVSETTLRTDSLQEGGHVWIYRPAAPDEGDVDTGGGEPADRTGGERPVQP